MKRLMVGLFLGILVTVAGAGAFLYFFLGGPVPGNKGESGQQAAKVPDPQSGRPGLIITGSLNVPDVLKPILATAGAGSFGKGMVRFDGVKFEDLPVGTLEFSGTSFPVKFTVSIPASVVIPHSILRIDLFYCYGKVTPEFCNVLTGNSMRARVFLKTDDKSLAAGKMDLGQVYFTRNISHPVEKDSGYTPEGRKKHVEDACGPGDSLISGTVEFSEEFLKRMPAGKQLGLVITPMPLFPSNVPLSDVPLFEGFITPEKPHFSFPRNRFFQPSHFGGFVVECDAGLSIKDCAAKALLPQQNFVFAKDVFFLVPKGLSYPFCDQKTPAIEYLHPFDTTVVGDGSDKPKNPHLAPELFEGTFK